MPDTVHGRRDRAILLTGDIEIEAGTVFYRYRGKGGKKGRADSTPIRSPVPRQSDQPFHGFPITPG
ncbi:MAG: hypothetical protein R6W93_03950 [Candidatus Limnocylindrales bacterium]